MSVRVATVADASAIQAIYAPEVEHGFASFETEPPDAQEMAARIARTLAVYPWLVWEEGGVVLGYAYGARHREREAYRWSVDVAVYVGPAARGRGVAGALYDRLLAVLGRQGFHGAFAGVAVGNAGSEALHRACGFEPVGIYREVGFKLGAWRDVGWWRRALTPAPTRASGQPAEPIPFAGLSPAHQRRA